MGEDEASFWQSVAELQRNIDEAVNALALVYMPTWLPFTRHARNRFAAEVKFALAMAVDRTFPRNGEK